MSCFPCFQSQKTSKSNSFKEPTPTPAPAPTPTPTPAPAPAPRGTVKQEKENERENEHENIESQAFTFRELASATKNFRQECLLGEGGFGRVYKGTLASTGQAVAIKQLDKNSVQANKFLAEVAILSRLHHPNLITLLGYCADGDQRLLVYEFINGESLQERLFERKEDKGPLDWFSRMRIAFATSKGLEYAHQTSNPPIIYRDLKPSNILLDEELTPKLSDLGLTRLSSSGDKLFQSSRVMGTYGYCSPEYSKNGELTTKSDVYSFGVILLELITGRKAIDPTKPVDEQNLVSWAQPIFRDPKRFPDIADPLLRKQFPEKELNQAVAIAAMCLQEESGARPFMSDVVTALSFLSMSAEDAAPPLHPLSPRGEEKDQKENNNEDRSDSDGSDHDSSDEYEDGDEEEYDDGSEYLDSESVDNDECSVHSGQEDRGDEPGREVSKVKSRAKSSKSRTVSSRKSSKRSRSRTKSSRKGKTGVDRNSSSGEE